MKRREFLTMAAGAGTLAPALASGATHKGVDKPQAIAEGGPLVPPNGRPILVAIAVGEWNTWIDFVGPQAVFETFRYDPESKKHVRIFELRFVGDSLEPRRNLVPDLTFENA